MTTVHIVVGASSCVSYPIDILHARVFSEDTWLDVFLWCFIFGTGIVVVGGFDPSILLAGKEDVIDVDTN